MAASSCPPLNFFCRISSTIMEHPNLGDCGHLFDITKIDQGYKCPSDQMPVTSDRCLPLPDLAKKIANWKSAADDALSNHLEQLKIAEGAATSSSNKNSCLSKKYVDDLKSNMRICNAHQDDVHALILTKPDTFVSGSKDTTIKTWNTQGEALKTLEPGYKSRGYESWVTAMTNLRDGYFASGTRDGNVVVWNPEGQEYLSLRYNPALGAQNSYVCKDRNKSRINCITENYFDENENTFFTGTPKYIQLWNADNGRLLKHWKAHENDWVYCIEPLKNDEILVVVGSIMEIWSHIHDNAIQATPLIRENPKDFKRAQRPHISAIARIHDSPNLVSSALFDGSVKVVDLAAQKIPISYREHTGRVWSVIELSPHLIASSADDKTIKLWDLRQRASIATLRDNIGRVSCLLKINEEQFISASCPDDISQSSQRANIDFWPLKIFHCNSSNTPPSSGGGI